VSLLKLAEGSSLARSYSMSTCRSLVNVLLFADLDGIRDSVCVCRESFLCRSRNLCGSGKFRFSDRCFGGGDSRRLMGLRALPMLLVIMGSSTGVCVRVVLGGSPCLGLHLVCTLTFSGVLPVDGGKELRSGSPLSDSSHTILKESWQRSGEPEGEKVGFLTDLTTLMVPFPPVMIFASDCVLAANAFRALLRRVVTISLRRPLLCISRPN
jgi:hypothetical protein